MPQTLLLSTTDRNCRPIWHKLQSQEGKSTPYTEHIHNTLHTFEFCGRIFGKWPTIRKSLIPLLTTPSSVYHWRGGPLRPASFCGKYAAKVKCAGGVQGQQPATRQSLRSPRIPPTHPLGGVDASGGQSSPTPGRITTTFLLPSATLSSIHLFPYLLPTTSANDRGGPSPLWLSDTCC
jgi:hypothetical protein